MRSTMDLSCRFALLSFVDLVLLQHVGAADEPSQFSDLQKERLAVLKQVAELTDRSFKTGQIRSSERVKAYQKLFKVEQNICENIADRMKAREQLLSLARTDEETSARLRRAGEADLPDLLKAIARRLAIEIELERIKSK